MLCSQRAEQLNAGEAPPLAPSHVVIETKSEEEEDEENAFPGADFLSVADVLQVSSICLLRVSSSPTAPPAGHKLHFPELDPECLIDP